MVRLRVLAVPVAVAWMLLSMVRMAPLGRAG